MAKARGQGEGSIYQRSSDGRWVAQIEAGRDAFGRRRLARRSRRTKAEAMKALKELQRLAEEGVSLDQQQTVAQYLDWWADHVCKGSVRQSTLDDYRGVLRRWVVPHIGQVKLAKLTPMHVQAMLRKLEDDGLSPRTRQYAHSVLRRALKWAVSSGMVSRNAAALAEGPKLSKRARLDDRLTAGEAKRVLAAAQGQALEAFAVLVLRRGLRRGEALGLRWADVDLDEGVATIAGTLKARPGGGAYRDAPKTQASARKVPLGGEVTRALREHRRRQAAAQIKAGRVWVDSGYVFTQPDGRPYLPNNASAWWAATTEAAGLGRRRLHASRHTCATLMLEEGVPLEVVSAILGHANLSITADIYAQVTADSKRRALARLDAAIDGQPVEAPAPGP